MNRQTGSYPPGYTKPNNIYLRMDEGLLGLAYTTLSTTGRASQLPGSCAGNLQRTFFN